MSDGHGVPPMVVRAAPAGTQWREIRHFEAIDSTNRYLADLAAGGTAPGVVAVADHQTAGRGRLGRRWEAPRGANLLVSVLLQPSFDMADFHLCGAAVGLAALSVCREAGLDAGIGLKWPNDLVVGERKLAGVLVEVVTSGPTRGGPPSVVVGLGLNVRWPPPEGMGGDDGVAADVADLATSVWRETGSVLGPLEVLDHVLAHVDGRLRDLESAQGRRRQSGDYRDACATIGRTVKVALAHEELTGRALDVTDEGHLVVETASGTRTITAGDVVHLRAEH